MATADQVVVELVAKTTQYQNNLKQAATTMRSVGQAATVFELKASTAMTGLGNAFTGAGQGAVKMTADVGKSLDAMASKTSRAVQSSKNALDGLIQKQLQYGRMSTVLPGNLPGLGGQSWASGGSDPFQPVKAGADRANQSVNRLGGSVGNIAAQFNDIGTTAAMGMNPMLIALQQGTQLSQVFAGQSTQQVVRGLGSAFASIFSPVSLMTIALVAGTAALAQWAMSAFGADEKTVTFAKSIDALNGEVEALRGYLDGATKPLSELEEKFGSNAAKAREVYTALAALQSLKAMDQISTAMGLANEQLDGLANRLARIDQVAATGQGMAVVAHEVRKIAEKFGLTEEQARLVNQRMDELANANGPREAAIAAGNLANALSSARDEAGNVPPAVRQLAIELLQASIQGLELEDAILDAKTAADSLAASGPGDGWLSNAIGAASDLATKLWDAARARAAAEGSEFVPVDPANVPNSGRPPPRAPSELGIPDIVKGGGGGGGAARRFDDQILKDIEAMRAEIEVLNSLSLGVGDYQNAVMAARKEAEMLQNLQNKGVPITGALRDQVRGLAQDWKDAADAQAEARARHEEFQTQMNAMRQSMEGAFVGWVTGANSFRDALSGVIAKLAEMAASRAFDLLWDGPKRGSGGGILGSIFSGIFGGARANGGPVRDNRAYLVGERGPEMFVPGQNGMIIPNMSAPKPSAGMASSAGSMDVRVYVDQDGNWQAAVENISAGVANATVDRRTPRIVGQSVQRVQYANGKSKAFLG